MQRIETEGAPKPVASYSQGILYGNFIFVSGQLGIDPETGKLLESFEEQSKQALKNLISIVETGGGSRCSIVRVTVYMKNLENFSKFNEIYEDFFKSCPVKPTRVVVGVSELPLGALLEVECIAVRG
jgi:2-iminobutanoate/2-iminopropanoate deaminase